MRQAVAAIVEYRGNVLVGKKQVRADAFLSGAWHIPGEAVEPGESDEAALKRGIREEAGIEIIVDRYLASHITPTDAHVKWYVCRARNYNISPGSDLDDIKWVPRKDVVNICSEKAVSVWPSEVRQYFS